MADQLTIRVLGTEYPFPSFDTLTYVEGRLIKKHTGIVVGQFYDALENGDPDAIFALALIARSRDGKPLNTDELNGMLLTDIELIVPEPDEPVEEPDPASPLDETPPGDDAASESSSSSDDERSSGS